MPYLQRLQKYNADHTNRQQRYHCNSSRQTPHTTNRTALPVVPAFRTLPHRSTLVTSHLRRRFRAETKNVRPKSRRVYARPTEHCNSSTTKGIDKEVVNNNKPSAARLHDGSAEASPLRHQRPRPAAESLPRLLFQHPSPHPLLPAARAPAAHDDVIQGLPHTCRRSTRSGITVKV